MCIKRVHVWNGESQHALQHRYTPQISRTGTDDGLETKTTCTAGPTNCTRYLHQEGKLALRQPAPSLSFRITDRCRPQGDAAFGCAGAGHGEKKNRTGSKTASLPKVRFLTTARRLHRYRSHAALLFGVDYTAVCAMYATLFSTVGGLRLYA